MACSVLVIGEMQPNIHTIETFDFLKYMIHSQIISFSVIGSNS